MEKRKLRTLKVEESIKEKLDEIKQGLSKIENRKVTYSETVAILITTFEKLVNEKELKESHESLKKIIPKELYQEIEKVASEKGEPVETTFREILQIGLTFQKLGFFVLPKEVNDKLKNFISNLPTEKREKFLNYFAKRMDALSKLAIKESIKKFKK